MRSASENSSEFRQIHLSPIWQIHQKDRILFSGVANTDYRFWGTGHWTTPGDTVVTQCGIPAWCNTNGPCAYGAERLAFILGNKLDVQDPTNNPVLDAINTARTNSNWMQRQPVF